MNAGSIVVIAVYGAFIYWLIREWRRWVRIRDEVCQVPPYAPDSSGLSAQQQDDLEWQRDIDEWAKQLPVGARRRTAIQPMVWLFDDRPDPEITDTLVRIPPRGEG